MMLGAVCQQQALEAHKVMFQAQVLHRVILEDTIALVHLEKVLCLKGLQHTPLHLQHQALVTAAAVDHQLWKGDI